MTADIFTKFGGCLGQGYIIGGEGVVTDLIYLDLCKTFDAVPHNVLVSILERCGFDRRITWQARVWLDGCTQILSSVTQCSGGDQ